VLGQRAAQHQPGQLTHQPELFGDPCEQGRRQRAEFGMFPARERLRGHHPARGQLDLGLEVGHQLAAAQRVREFGAQPDGHVLGFDCHPRPFPLSTVRGYRQDKL